MIINELNLSPTWLGSFPYVAWQNSLRGLAVFPTWLGKIAYVAWPRSLANSLWCRRQKARLGLYKFFYKSFYEFPLQPYARTRGAPSPRSSRRRLWIGSRESTVSVRMRLSGTRAVVLMVASPQNPPRVSSNAKGCLPKVNARVSRQVRRGSPQTERLGLPTCGPRSPQSPPLALPLTVLNSAGTGGSAPTPTAPVL